MPTSVPSRIGAAVYTLEAAVLTTRSYVVPATRVWAGKETVAQTEPPSSFPAADTGTSVAGTSPEARAVSPWRIDRTRGSLPDDRRTRTAAELTIRPLPMTVKCSRTAEVPEIVP